MDHFLTTLCQTPGPGVGPKQRQNEGFWGIPALRMEPFRVPEWSKMGPKWVILGYFEVLLFLLKRFESLLRARAKVYSILRSDPNPRARPLLEPSGIPGRPTSEGRNMAKSLILPFNGSRLRTWSGPKMVQKWVQNGSKMGHFGVPSPQIGPFRGSRPRN